MSVAVKNQLSPLGDRAEKEARKRRREILRSWTLRCPQCKQVWLVVGAREGGRHKCKSCGRSFTVKPHR
ncbi:MAG: hypothetical protein H0T92_20910 [Pyrinomonadaceae bacterium]|nr:hypothetical protein [Pyrinomonadaceae bacterium]